MTKGFAEERHDVEGEGEDRDDFVAVDWFGVPPFQSIVGKVHDVRANTAIQRPTAELP